MRTKNNAEIKYWPQKLEKDMTPCHSTVIQISERFVVYRVEILHVCLVRVVELSFLQRVVFRLLVRCVDEVLRILFLLRRTKIVTRSKAAKSITVAYDCMVLIHHFYHHI